MNNEEIRKISEDTDFFRMPAHPDALAYFIAGIMTVIIPLGILCVAGWIVRGII